MERIWNLQELQSMPKWKEDKEGDWLNIIKNTWITKEFIGEPIDSLKQKGYPVLDEMIAKTETELVQEAIDQANDKLKERLDKGEIGITLDNGNTIKVGDKIRLDDWHDSSYAVIIAFGKEKMITKFHLDGFTDEELETIEQDWEPYEPKEELKPLETWTKTMDLSFTANSYGFKVELQQRQISNLGNEKWVDVETVIL